MTKSCEISSKIEFDKNDFDKNDLNTKIRLTIISTHT